LLRSKKFLATQANTGDREGLELGTIFGLSKIF